MSELPLDTVGDARFSSTGDRRYILTRGWTKPLGTDKRVLWVMLNPSTAGAKEDDPTVRRCSNFARSWGYAGIIVVNLFSLIATRPIHLSEEPATMASNEAMFLRYVFRSPKVAMVMAAWGSQPILTKNPDRWRTVVTDVVEAGHTVMSLGTTADGSPRHPLYVRGDSAPQLWKMPSMIPSGSPPRR